MSKARKPGPKKKRPEEPPSTQERGQTAGLVDEIRKDPLADAPRQVLADILEQRGDARGQLIQLQIRRARLPSWDVQAIELGLQERVLLAEHEQRWRAELPQLDGVTWGPFSRGFVGKVAFRTFDAFVEHAEACFAATPVHAIAIPWPRSGKQAEVDAIAGLRELTVFGTAMRKQDLDWLMSSPLLTTIRSLTLLDSQLQSLANVLKSPHLGGLEALCLPLHLLDDGSFYKLAQTPLPSLATLEISAGSPEQEYGSGRRRSPRRIFGNYAAIALAGWRGLAQIRSLEVSGAKLGAEGLTALLKSPHTKGLRALAVRSVADAKWDVDDSLTAFAGGPAGTLDELDISDNDLDAQGAGDLAGCRALQELKVLRIERVVSKHFDRLVKAPWFDSLRVLACGEAGLLPIVKRAPKQLHTLRVVADAAVPRELVRRLTSAPLPGVIALDLSDARLGDDGLRLLGTVETLPGVIALELAAAGATPRFTRAAVEEFTQSPFARQLRSLETGFAELDRLPAAPRIAIGQGEYKGPRRYL
ncbi:MAG: hypothetical protein ABI867_05490 [Kofleriaceae bacterium]